jgi:Domain of unknown function (DUF4157)
MRDGRPVASGGGETLREESVRHAREHDPPRVFLLPHCDSDGGRAPSGRELARADAVPMHPTQRIRPSGASVAGILPDGVVHPAVQSEIASTRGSGASLDSGVQERFADSLGDLSYVRVHTDDTADRLNRSVSARAFETGTDVYVTKRECSPGSACGS